MKRVILLFMTVTTLVTAKEFEYFTLECDAYRYAARYKLDMAKQAGSLDKWKLALDNLKDSEIFTQALLNNCKLTDSGRSNAEGAIQNLQKLKTIAKSRL